MSSVHGGTGNFSIRFYEALCNGRIPVLHDTDTLLPLDRLINWKKLCVFTKTIEELPEAIVQFHRTRDLVRVQAKCTQVYQTYFSPERIGYFLWLQTLGFWRLLPKFF